MVLFDIDHHSTYGIHIYGHPSYIGFIQATSLYHPSTVVQSLKHDGSGAEPGLKDTNGNWDLTPHKSRIQRVDRDVLATWHAVLEDESVPVDQTRMVYTVNKSTAAVLAKLAKAPRVGSLNLQFSRGWDESIDRKKGRFDSEWGRPESWDSVILQGPHIHVANPFYKSPNPTMKHNQDWTPVDLEALPVDAIPVTQYKPRGDSERYDSAYTHWEVNGHQTSARESFRIAWRRMAANTGERTLIPALVPPGAAHVNAVFAFGDRFGNLPKLLAVAGMASSLLADLCIRAVPKGDIYQSAFNRLPVASDSDSYSSMIAERVLRLNCLTKVFAPLWEEATGTSWTTEVPYRIASKRRMALIELDALVALSLGVTADELTTIYRTQFPVLYGYDHKDYLYDAKGRLVPPEIKSIWKSAGSPSNQCGSDSVIFSSIHPQSGIEYTYELPFNVLDREADLRAAYTSFLKG